MTVFRQHFDQGSTADVQSKHTQETQRKQTKLMGEHITFYKKHTPKGKSANVRKRPAKKRKKRKLLNIFISSGTGSHFKLKPSSLALLIVINKGSF